VVRRIVLLGGTSSVGIEMIRQKIDDSAHFLSTFRDADKIPADLRQKSQWVELSLSTFSEISLKSHLEAFSPSEVFVLLGKLSGFKLSLSNSNDLNSYFNDYITNLSKAISLCSSCLNLETPSHLVFVSSRASHKPSNDFPYAASKASVEALMRTLSLSASINHSYFSVRFGLIRDSEMFRIMGPHVDSHILRSQNKLLDLPQIASILLSLIPSKTQHLNGTEITIGPDYE